MKAAKAIATTSQSGMLRLVAGIATSMHLRHWPEWATPTFPNDCSWPKVVPERPHYFRCVL